MSLQIGFKQVLRISPLQKTFRSAGSIAIYERQASQLWSPSSYNHVTSRLASTKSYTPKTENKKSKVSDDQDAVQLFYTHRETGTLTKPLATSCLRDLDRRNRHDTGLGEATIKWMWNEHDRYEFPRDKDLLDQMVKHLVKEGKEDMLWNWIEQKSRKTDSLGPKDRFVWRSDAVKSLVRAKAFASDADNLDGALESFERARRSTYSIPLAPARMTMAQLLMMPKDKTGIDSVDSKAEMETPKWPNTSIELWEDFFKGTDRHQDVSEPLSVQLPLYHPGGPNAMPFLKHCRYLATKEDLVRNMAKRPSVTPWIARGRHAEAVLRQQGHEKDADWLGEFIRDLHTKAEPLRRKEKSRKVEKFARTNKK
ncbi:hypothetical protein M436DRAFT_46933 [Aureobasidium namibiae CBS 147.97]|uniref:Uncharacterized protein n=1 Tax=Aureobasidium namibiae CBS 147.97 TaxID=1043004 RepID=A0A074WJG2_9PEZI